MSRFATGPGADHCYFTLSAERQLAGTPHAPRRSSRSLLRPTMVVEPSWPATPNGKGSVPARSQTTSTANAPARRDSPLALGIRVNQRRRELRHCVDQVMLGVVGDLMGLRQAEIRIEVEFDIGM